MKYRDALQFLYGLQTFGIKLGLRNITNVLRKINDPHRCFQTLHIAGTNGKGSTAAIVESVLRTAGYKTGLYTSPHLFDFTERIRVKGRPIPRRRVSQGVEVLKPLIEEYRCTYFESVTALAFHHFCQEQVDIAIVEVGLGGRLDATNVISPLGVIITDIDNDHTEHLGGRLMSIAQEKTAIVKERCAVVTSAANPEVFDVVRGTCQKKDATLYTTREHCALDVRDMSSRGSFVDVRTTFRTHSNIRFPLIGEHQLRNLAAAVLTLDVINDVGFSTTEGDIVEGVSQTVWPGRFQIIGRNPLFIVDGAHNPGGVWAFTEALRKLFVYKRMILVFGVMANKNYEEMAELLVPLADHVVVTRPAMDRALDCHLLAECVKKYNSKVEIVQTVVKAASKALELAGSGDAVCAVGSLFVTGEILKSKFRRVDALFGLN